MEQVVRLSVLFLLLPLSCQLQVLPNTKQTDQHDMASMMSQMTLMEQTIKTLQSQMSASNNELASMKTKQLSTESELSSVKTALQSQLLAADAELTTVKSRLQTTESELTTVKSTLQTTESELTSMKSKQQTTESDLTTVTSQLASAQAEIGVLKQDLAKVPDTKEYTQMKADLAVLRAQFSTLTSHLNATVIDRIGADLVSNTNNIQILNASCNSLHNYIGNINASAQKNAGDISGLKTELSSLNRIHQSLKTSISGINILIQNNAGDIAGLQTELTSVKSLNTEVNVAKTLCQKTMSEIKLVNSDVSDISGKVTFIQNSLSNITGSRIHSSFEVLQMKDNASHNNNDVLTFDDVTLNTGNAYNPKTGIFTAPVDGTYLFWANIMSRESGYFDISLMKESQEIATGYTSHGNNYGIATITHVVQMKKGEGVWFEQYYHGETNLIGNGVSNYGGTLLYM